MKDLHKLYALEKDLNSLEKELIDKYKQFLNRLMSSKAGKEISRKSRKRPPRKISRLHNVNAKNK